jgi:hypothetical protein
MRLHAHTKCTYIGGGKNEIKIIFVLKTLIGNWYYARI